MTDNVNHPKHYTFGRIEVIEAIEDWKLSFHRGNAIKYVARAGVKNPDKTVEDLEKAVWYLKREIELVKSQTEKREPLRPNDMNPISSATPVSTSNSSSEQAATVPIANDDLLLLNLIEVEGVWGWMSDKLVFIPDQIQSALTVNHQTKIWIADGN
jgi:hypothetical protein